MARHLLLWDVMGGVQPAHLSRNRDYNVKSDFKIKTSNGEVLCSFEHFTKCFWKDGMLHNTSKKDLIKKLEYLNMIDGHLMLRLVGAGDDLLPAPHCIFLSGKFSISSIQFVLL